MTFSIFETSKNQGSPVDLYHFRAGFTNFYYCTGEYEMTIDGFTYEPMQISRSKISESPEIDRGNLKVTLPYDAGVGRVFVAAPPDEVMTLDVRTTHLKDPDEAASLIWSGRVLTASWANEKLTMHVETSLTSLKRMGLRLRYQKTCPYQLYGPGCTLSADAHKSVGTLAGLSGVDASLGGGVSIPEDGYYTGGYLQWVDLAGVHRAYVVEQVGGVFTLQYVPTGLVGGIEVAAFPGCDRTIETCQDKFSNEINCGAFPYIPPENPFSGKIF